MSKDKNATYYDAGGIIAGRVSGIDAERIAALR